MPSKAPPIRHLEAFEAKMAAAGLDPMVIALFADYYRQVVRGATGRIPDDAIRPPHAGEVARFEALASYRETGLAALPRAVRITLNGGLGTSMGLTGPKSLLAVKNGQTFLEIIVGQSQRLKFQQVFMNSFSTQAATEQALQTLAPAQPPLMFTQNRFPKILLDSLAPADWPPNPDLEWNPPGHGDIYTAMATAGILDRLLDQGLRYALICNSDNLGATMDADILGFFAQENLPFLMEVAERTPADAKGGHLAVDAHGALLLRESAQFPENSDGRDIARYRFFNTNNLWVNLAALKDLVARETILRLPLILNPKHLDPRDSASPKVFQVESAMGAAIALFDGAQAVRVPRTRFFPVKTCNDLLAVRSDAFRLNDDLVLEPHPDMTGSGPIIALDERFYKHIDMFDARFPDGVPSLVRCARMQLEGDILFAGGITVIGDVTIRNPHDRQATLEADTVVDRDLQL
jgi:UTP--glucose-1-phosphate uridylyltransferase